MIATDTRVPTVILTSSCYDEAEIDFNHMSLLDLEHSGKLCEDLIIHGSNYGFIGSGFAATANVSDFPPRCAVCVVSKLHQTVKR